jgi:hypothetical protein
VSPECRLKHAGIPLPVALAVRRPHVKAWGPFEPICQRRVFLGELSKGSHAP